MGKLENKLTLGFTEKDLERLFDRQRSNSVLKKKLVVNHGDTRIDILQDFSFCHVCECELTFDKSRWHEADVIILTDENYPKGECV
ncbi:unnamed protein product [Heterobilharzia americana]|nr:unnamed protein product [Heterobilharzia americana]